METSAERETDLNSNDLKLSQKKIQLITTSNYLKSMPMIKDEQINLDM